VALILDTGVLYAALDTKDRDHQACADLIAGTNEELVVPEPVLVELDYWLRKNATIEVWRTFAEDVELEAYILWPVDADLLLAAARLQSRFSDQDLGFVDAAVFCTCEALGEKKVATLDHRHFSVLRNSAGSALELLPL
jgi:predicted nucleic acid-binding protein